MKACYYTIKYHTLYLFVCIQIPIYIYSCLSQVETALEVDKDKAELLDLKGQLEEMVALTCELLGKSVEEVMNKDKCPYKRGDIVMAMSSIDRQ